MKKGSKQIAGVGDPVRVPDGVPRLEKWGQRVCQEHQRVKCDLCAKRGKSIAVCCGLHHRDGDGLAVKMCEKHRMTVCATCKTVRECCEISSHHLCLRHELPTCDGCKQYGDLRSRRPGQCCKRGHHDTEYVARRSRDEGHKSEEEEQKRSQPRRREVPRKKKRTADELGSDTPVKNKRTKGGGKTGKAAANKRPRERDSSLESDSSGDDLKRRKHDVVRAKR